VRVAEQTRGRRSRVNWISVWFWAIVTVLGVLIIAAATTAA
jgi:hypothetical protein